jgi:nucleotide-binding universal stress UspA family protein
MHEVFEVMRLKKILVGIDFSEHSEAAFRYARFLARIFSANIQAIHVVDRRHIEKIAHLYGDQESNVTKKLCLQAKEQFDTFLNKNNPEGIPVRQIITAGTPFQAIAFKAQALGSDIIVMGGHGRMGDGQIDKIFFGSNAERVVRLLPCPVICVPLNAL